MNDLAEKALHGLDAARRVVRDRAMVSFAVSGLVVAAVVVVTGGRVGAASATRPLTTWLGLQDPHPADVTDVAPASVMLAATLVLLTLWLAVVRYVRRHPQPTRRVWGVAAAWAAPFVVGPPLLDTAVYGYAATGLIRREGADPYLHPPSSLGGRAIVAAIDPASRGTQTGTGPVGTELAHLSVSISGGSALGAVLVLRALAVLAAVWIGRQAVELAAARGVDGAQALTLTVLNPVLLLYVVSGAHLDGLLLAFVLNALALAAVRRWLAAVVAAALGATVLGQGWLVVAMLVVAHWCHARDRTRRVRVRAASREIAVAALIAAATGFAVPHGFGWLGNVGAQFSTHTPYSIAGGTSALLTPIVHGASYDDLAIGGRAAALIALAAAIGYLVVTARSRPPEVSAGYALLALALLAPSLFPWYLLWAMLCLAPSATAARRAVVLVLAAVACVLSPPGFTATTTTVVTGALLLVIAAVTLGAARSAPARDLAYRRADVGEVDGGNDDRDQRERAVVDGSGEAADGAGDGQDQ